MTDTRVLPDPTEPNDPFGSSGSALPPHTAGKNTAPDPSVVRSPSVVPPGPEKAASEGTSVVRSSSVVPPSSSGKWPSPLAEPAFHGLAGDVVRAIEPHTEADPVAILTQLLGAFGNCVGRGPHYRVESDEHHANLYAVLVGDSSKARKGTSWGRTRSLFKMIDGDDWADRCVHSGLSSGEGVIWAVRDPIMGREKEGKGAAAQYVEREIDAGVSDKRLMVVESEFANVLRVMGREGNTLSRVIRDGWDRGDLAVMTKTSPAVATGAHLSIVGHITGDELRRYLDRTEAANGFANRFLYMCVKRARLLPHGGDMDEQVMQRLAQRLAAAIGAARRIGRVRMDEAARATWEIVYADLSEGRPGLVGSVTARGEAQVIRLATLYALIDGTDTMSPHHLEAALAVWTYAEESARYIFGDSRGDPMADTLAQALRDAGEAGMTRTAIRDHFGRNADALRIDSAISVLSASGLVMKSKAHTGGRSAEIWRWTTTEDDRTTEGSAAYPDSAADATTETTETTKVITPATTAPGADGFSHEHARGEALTELPEATEQPATGNEAPASGDGDAVPQPKPVFRCIGSATDCGNVIAFPAQRPPEPEQTPPGAPPAGQPPAGPAPASPTPAGPAPSTTPPTNPPLGRPCTRDEYLRAVGDL
ncbi:MAG TPA: hypothetical protein VIP27_10760 [Variovorax sp.]